jgi:hypothetical protein
MKMIFNPFSRFPTNTLLITGILLTIAGGLLAYYFNVRYDGAIDLHFSHDVAIQTPFLELLANIACLGLLLFAAAKLINAKTRPVDVLSAVLVARLPFYLMTPFNNNGRIYEAMERIQAMVSQNDMNIAPDDMLVLVLLGFVSLLLMVWFFALLWNGFKVACNAKGPIPVFFFIGAVIIAEIITKVIIIYTL